MKYHIPCLHETGEVREARVDDYYPLDCQQISQLLIAASKSDCASEVSSIQVRLNQGIKGIKCPRELDGQAAKRELEMDELYVETYQSNRAELPGMVERFNQILNG
jgi:hypothetical protein